MSSLSSPPKAEQLDFFVAPGLLAMPAPRSRRADPPTSSEAAATHRERIRGQARAVLEAVRRHPGLTACELARRMVTSDAAYQRQRYTVSRRCADLERDGLVSKGEPRECTVAGSRQMTWWAV